MKQTLTMTAKVEQYLAFRRAMGYRLRIEGRMLQQFARYADDVGHRGPLTVDLATRWARLPRQADRMYAARRLEVVRCFARHQIAVEPATQIPPQRLLGRAHRRTAPHIYSDAEMRSLLSAAGRLGSTNGLRARTYFVLIGLLASTGLRISEALRLSRADVNLTSGIVTVRQTKFNKSRLVPLHPSAVVALKGYVHERDRSIPRPRDDHFFLSDAGARLPYSTARCAFRKLCDHEGITGTGRRPRFHDLRHTFACRRVEAWYDAGVDLSRAVAALCVYLGHAKVSDTYWYLTATPELMARAAVRFETFGISPTGEVTP